MSSSGGWCRDSRRGRRGSDPYWGAAWLGMAALDWLHRSTLLGGIYGRPVAYPNFVLFLVSALVLVRVLLRPDMPAVIWLLALPVFGLAVAWALLLFRGPFDPLPR